MDILQNNMQNKYKSIPGMLFLVSIFLLFSTNSFSQDPPIRILLATGGGWHDYETQEKLLTDAITKRLGDQVMITVIHEGDGEPDYHLSIFRDENWGEDFDVVLHNTGFGRVNDPEFVAHLVEQHKGTPAVLIHASIHSYRFAEPADPWFRFIGLRSMSHEAQREFEIENIAPAHPIMVGFPDRWMSPVDEVYIVEELWGEITPLAQAWGVDTEEYHPVFWTHEADGIRIFAATPGHNNEIFYEDEFINVVINGILWAVERL